MTGELSEAADGRPKRKSVFLSPQALHHLKVTASRRGTERRAVEEALALLVEHDERAIAMQEFLDWAADNWGEPDDEARARAAEIMSQLDP